MRAVLVKSIESLRPDADEQVPSKDWETYEILHCSYVQRISQRVVADQLAISARQLRRQQSAALDALADVLLQRYGLQMLSTMQEIEASDQANGEMPDNTVLAELAWLRSTPLDGLTDCVLALTEAIELARPLAETRGLRIELAPTGDLPKLTVHPLALRQLFLSVLDACMAVVRDDAGGIVLSAQNAQLGVSITVVAECLREGLSATSDPDEPSLAIARQLAGLCGCKLSLNLDATRFQLDLVLPGAGRLPVLVVDDNPDTLQLFHRYLAGTRYRFHGLQDGALVVEAANKIAPEVIILDIMMPHSDGWSILGDLRRNPFTADTPVLVCTILPQDALARSLGANSLVQKPVTRRRLLDALDDLEVREEKGLR
jgi:CheY-like chemotaxis protein